LAHKFILHYLTQPPISVFIETILPSSDPPNKPSKDPGISFQWLDINPEDKWIYQPFFHPFDQVECPVTLLSSPHPSQIVAAYHDPAFDSIELVADFVNPFSTALRGVCKVMVNMWQYLYSSGVTSMLTIGEFFPTHDSVMTSSS
jgi:hypothetical protein